MQDKKLQAMCYIPASVAVLCEDCRCISNGVLNCPACGSAAIANVAPWLERKTEPEWMTLEDLIGEPPRNPWRVFDNKPQLIGKQ